MQSWNLASTFKSNKQSVRKSADAKILQRRPTGANLQKSAQIAKHVALRNGGSRPESYLGKLIFHPRFESFGGCVVLFNFMIMTMETHVTATGDDGLMNFVTVVNRILLAYYTAECALRLYVMRGSFFFVGWNILDFLIVIAGVMSEVLEGLKVGGSGMEQITMLKSLRMLRLIRLVRLLVAFRELYMLVAGIGRCMKTLFWASGLIFMILNVWAILSVEFLDAKVKELAEAHAFGTCSWCPSAFSNIWYANLTWFQIVSTADWSTIGRPLAENFYWPYAFFILNTFVVIWGLLNLIVAGLVDANIAAREDDIAAAAEMAAQGFEEAWNSFAQICVAMDVDGSGDISGDEFKEFLKGSTELQQHLTIMGVQEEDVNDLLALMDDDGSGSLESDDFIKQFTLMRTRVVKTSLYFLMKHVQSMEAKLLAQSEAIESICKDVADIRSANLATIPTEKVDNEFLPAQTSDRGSPAAAGAAEKPHVDMQKFPSGWYYFGATLPLETSPLFKAVDLDGEIASGSRLQTDDFKAKESTVFGQVATADVGDIELSLKASEDLPATSVDDRANSHDAGAKLLPQMADSATLSGVGWEEIKFQPDNPKDMAQLVTKEVVLTTDGQKWTPVPPSAYVYQIPKSGIFRMPSEASWDESGDPSSIPMDFPSAEMFQPTADAEQAIRDSLGCMRHSRTIWQPQEKSMLSCRLHSEVGNTGDGQN